MTLADLRALRASGGWPAPRLAAALLVDRSTVNRWLALADDAAEPPALAAVVAIEDRGDGTTATVVRNPPAAKPRGRPFARAVTG